MVLTLYGNPTPASTCSQRVLTILKEKNVPFVFKAVDWDDLDSVDYAKLQPFRQIPVLNDDGFMLYESRAMGRYIAMKYSESGTPNLIPNPANINETATFEQAMSIETTQFRVVAELLNDELVFKPSQGKKINQKTVRDLEQQLDRKLDAYEMILSKTAYLAGGHITLADLFHLPYAQKFNDKVLPGVLTSPKRPNVARWWTNISSRQSWLAVKDGIVVEMEA